MDDYQEFLRHKAIVPIVSGLESVPELHKSMFPHQRDVCSWALRLGRAAAFLGTGMGKTLIELEWARVVSEHCHAPVLILAPLAVAQQTVREAAKFGLNATYHREQPDTPSGIIVTNYERLENFTPEDFAGVVLDESSILKSFDGKTRSALIDAFKSTKYKLAGTATPAPNDYMELGNHSEFLGVMTATEMLSMFFVHDGGETQKWRLKGHARSEFWKWVCSWAVSMRKPSDIGYSDEGFELPELVHHHHMVEVDTPSEGMLFAMPAQTLQERIGARKASIELRVTLARDIILDSWTNSKSETTTVSTKTPTENGSMPGDGSATRRTRNAKSPRLTSGGKRIETSISSPKLNTETPTELGSESTPSDGTSKSEQKSSPTTSDTGAPKGTYTETGISEKSSESAWRNTGPYSHLSVADAQYAEYQKIRSQSITATQPEKCEDSSVPSATPDSAISETTLNDCAQQPRISKPQWVAWCNLNDEQDLLSTLLGKDCVSIFGSLSSDEKLRRFKMFEDGEVSVLVTKGAIFGYGINMQFCSNQVFVGLTDSWELFFQSVRRLWRFGQNRTVHSHIIAASTEGNVVENLARKDAEAQKMAEEMAANTQDLTRMNLRGTTRTTSTYTREKAEEKNWTMHLADCIDLAKELPDNSMHFSVYSPPFESLYTYSNSERDMGNSKSTDEFWEHYRFLIRETFRVMMHGRLVSIHCMNLPTSKVRDGVIGIRDFRGEIIRAFEEVGFIYHSEVCIWKDPVTAMQRTKALGLLHKQIKKDSCMSRQGIPDYLVTMRKPGDNPERVTNDNESFPVQLWQQYASPIWMDINPSDTLQHRSAREHEDERHICPLQLEVIRRAIKLWSNPGDVVWSPFAGIGSEGVVAIEMGRRFLGSELKRSYWSQAVKNLTTAHHENQTLFDVDE